MSSRPYSEATQAAVDREVSRLLREAEERATGLLRGHRPELDALVGLLLERETVDGSDVYRLAGLPDQSEGLGATTVAESARVTAASDIGAAGVTSAVTVPLSAPWTAKAAENECLDAVCPSTLFMAISLSYHPAILGNKGMA